MLRELRVSFVRVLVQVLDPVGVEGGRTPDQTVDLVPLREKQLGQVRPVLPGDPGDERLFAHALPPSFWRLCPDTGSTRTVRLPLKVP